MGGMGSGLWWRSLFCRKEKAWSYSYEYEFEYKVAEF